jgi:hypothetical protein
MYKLSSFEVLLDDYGEAVVYTRICFHVNIPIVHYSVLSARSSLQNQKEISFVPDVDSKRGISFHCKKENSAPAAKLANERGAKAVQFLPSVALWAPPPEIRPHGLPQNSRLFKRFLMHFVV